METRTNVQQELSAEERIAYLEHQLLQAQKLTALGELVSTTSHEFNNVLMTIMNYAKIGMRHKDDATRDKSFDKILTASQRAAKITNAVLGVARNRGNQFEPTDLKEIIEESLFLLDREMNKYRIRVERDYQETPQAVACGNQVQQVLLNLLINARQAMREGGTILIRLAYDPQLHAVALTVRDSGTGIPADKLPKIFDSFYSTKSGPDESGKGGTGLGLASCKHIIEAHRGKIRVESTVGVGTAFTILLPAVGTPNRSAIPSPNLPLPENQAVPSPVVEQ